MTVSTSLQLMNDILIIQCARGVGEWGRGITTSASFTMAIDSSYKLKTKLRQKSILYSLAGDLNKRSTCSWNVTQWLWVFFFIFIIQSKEIYNAMNVKSSTSLKLIYRWSHETKQFTSEGTLTLADACDSKMNSTYQLENKTNTILK